MLICSFGGIPYTAHGAQMTPPSLFLFVYFLFLCLFKVRLGLPRRVGKEILLGPRRVRAQKIYENQKYGGGVFVLQEHNSGKSQKSIFIMNILFLDKVLKLKAQLMKIRHVYIR